MVEWLSDNRASIGTFGIEFTGYVAETEDTSGWVKRIEIDSEPIPSRMVGYTDDLYFGTGDVTGIVDPCPLDVNCDGGLSFGDILEILEEWGACEGCRADLDGNGQVAFGDLVILLGNWGPCS